MDQAWPRQETEPQLPLWPHRQAGQGNTKLVMKDDIHHLRKWSQKKHFDRSASARAANVLLLLCSCNHLQSKSMVYVNYMLPDLVSLSWSATFPSNPYLIKAKEKGMGGFDC